MATDREPGRRPPGGRAARAAAAPLPAGGRAHAPVARLLPSARSLLAAFAIVAGAGLAYLVARDTGVFAVRSVSVRGAPAPVAQQVRQALRGELGTSLLRVDLERARTEVSALPTVAAVSFDRAFPHTLRVTILPERPVAVVRQGAASWLVSARGRVMTSLVHGARRDLPRIWVGKGTALAPGATVAADLHDALAAAVPLTAAHLAGRVNAVATTRDGLVLELRSGIELRLGGADEIPLKLAVALSVLRLVSSDTRYVDVSVPERPVAGTILQPPTGPTAPAGTTSSTLDPQVQPEASTSTGP